MAFCELVGKSTIFKKMGASEYAEEINGLQINPLRRLRFRRLTGISLCCKFYPRFRNAQKCLFYVARSHRLCDAPALARTPSTSYGIGHCDPPSVKVTYDSIGCRSRVKTATVRRNLLAMHCTTRFWCARESFGQS